VRTPTRRSATPILSDETSALEFMDGLIRNASKTKLEVALSAGYDLAADSTEVKPCANAHVFSESEPAQH
jgi:hypothetical protein